MVAPFNTVFWPVLCSCSDFSPVTADRMSWSSSFKEMTAAPNFSRLLYSAPRRERLGLIHSSSSFVSRLASIYNDEQVNRIPGKTTSVRRFYSSLANIDTTSSRTSIEQKRTLEPFARETGNGLCVRHVLLDDGTYRVRTYGLTLLERRFQAICADWPCCLPYSRPSCRFSCDHSRDSRPQPSAH